MPENTVLYRNFLQGFLKENNIKSVLDFGCGDWQFSRFIDWSGISYIGVDVVLSIIEANRKQYGRDTIRFELIDSTWTDMPSADLILVKDVLQHWPNLAIEAFKPKLRSYNCSLITNTLETFDVSNPSNRVLVPDTVNRDIAIGDFRPLDLTLDPFNWKVKELFRYISPRKHAYKEETKVVVTLEV